MYKELTGWVKHSDTVITGHSGRPPKLRLWNNTMVNCLPVKSWSGLAGLPMEWPESFSFLGLSQGVAPSWSEEELALLRTHYAEGIEYVISLLPGRSRKAIFRQASLAGLTSRSSWSSEEKAFLEKHYRNLPTKEIAARLGRSVSAVRAAVVKFDLGTGKNRPWSEWELVLMQAHYSKGIDKIKASLPNRTREAIFAQAGKMGLTEARLWQPVEDCVLRDIYPERGVPGVRERLPHRTIPAIKHRVKALGLRSFRRKNG